MGAFLILSPSKTWPSTPLPDCLSDGNNTQSLNIETAGVDAVLDGDTFTIESGQDIRLAGIRAPKHLASGATLRTAPYANIAQTFLTDLLTDKSISVVPGTQRRDRYDRIVGQVLVRPRRSESFWLQEYLLQAGMARVDLSLHDQACGSALFAAEQTARQRRQGLWASSFYRIRQHDDLEDVFGTFELVEGTVLDVAHRRNRYFLNFGADWREDFTITIPPNFARSFTKKLNPMTLNGRKVRVRGWVESYNGPFIEAAHPGQIEIIDEKPKIAPF